MILFTKYSNERAPELCIRTEICEENGKRFVRKLPEGREAASHVSRIAAAYEELKEAYRLTKFVPNELVPDGEGVRLEYLTGHTLEEEIDADYLGERERLVSVLSTYLEEIDRTADRDFEISPGFVHVFGQVELPEGLRSSRCVNIDMVLNNIICARGQWQVIDYEWTFPFMIPSAYVKWRTLHYYINGNTKRFFLNDLHLYEEFGFTEGEIAAFSEMERNFQNYITGSYVPLRELYEDISDGAVDLPAILKKVAGRGDGNLTAKLYLDRGEGFTEADTVLFPVGENGRVSFRQPISGVLALRIDPCDFCCSVTIENLATELGPIDLEGVAANGTKLDLRRTLFDTSDPFYLVAGWPEDAHFLSGQLKIQTMDADSAEFARSEIEKRNRRIAELKENDRKKEDLLAWRSEAVRQLMKTTPMRAYRKLRVKTNKSDPYTVLRPLLPSDPEGILYCIDHCAHRKEVYFLRGWAFDREYSGEEVKIVNAKDEVIPCEVRRFSRPDAAAAFDLPEERKIGFSIEIPYSAMNNLPLYLEVEDPRGYTCEALAIEPDPSKREAFLEKLAKEKPEKKSTRDYDDWARDHALTEAELDAQRREQFADGPLFSIVVPLYKTDPELLRELVDSVKAQTYSNWELILSDGSGPDSPLTDILSQLWAEEARIRTIVNETQLHISENTNAAIRLATGSYLVFCDHDDLLTPDALYENAKVIAAHPDADLIYSDEDKLAPGGVLDQPNFKPDFNPDFLTSVNYICHLTVVRREFAQKTGLLDPAFDGAQDYDFILRCTENTKEIYHIPKVLYHWRETGGSTAVDPASKQYAFDAGSRALKAHYDRIGVPAEIRFGSHPGLYRTKYNWTGTPLVSVVIPNKDHIEDLKTCIRSIEEKSTWPAREYVIIENNSTEAETFAGYEELQKQYGNITLVTYKGSFNYSAINNYGAGFARGEYLLFLNNDTEMINADALEEMLGPGRRPDVGAVGARLYYEDGSIQHAGVVLGFGDIAGHAFKEADRYDTGYQHRIIVSSDMSAVTAACMLVRKAVFDEVEGFYEGLAVAFNDIDLCLKIRKAGYQVVYDPYAEFYHYESKSRGYEDTPEKEARFKNEVAVFKERWQKELLAGDPCYNPNLTLKRSDFSLKDSDEYDK